MPTATVGPRVESDTAGYVRIRCWDGEREHYLYLHRLAAYAAGEIDALDAGEHVHHVDGDRWNNAHDNLEAVTPEAHDRRHDHPVIADGGTHEHPSPFVTRRDVDAGGTATPDKPHTNPGRCTVCGAFLAEGDTTADCDHQDGRATVSNPPKRPPSPAAALEAEGTLHKTRGGACRVVHRVDNCRALKSASRPVDDIEHRAQLPLRAGLCTEPKCWPEEGEDA